MVFRWAEFRFTRGHLCTVNVCPVKQIGCVRLKFSHNPGSWLGGWFSNLRRILKPTLSLNSQETGLLIRSLVPPQNSVGLWASPLPEIPVSSVFRALPSVMGCPNTTQMGKGLERLYVWGYPYPCQSCMVGMGFLKKRKLQSMGGGKDTQRWTRLEWLLNQQSPRGRPPPAL